MKTIGAALKRVKESEGGQSLTEFAIIAPVMVGILIFSIFFYEATQIKLKQQEAERFLVWEFTGKKLTDYGNNGNQTALYTQAKSAIDTEMKERYANLVSTNKLHNQSHYVMTAWNLTATKWGGNKSPPDIPGGGLVNLLWNIFKTVFVIWDMQTWTSANAVHYAMMAGSQTQPTFGGSGAISSQFDAAKQWKFNTNGYISAKLEWQIKPTVMLTKNFMDTRFDNKKFRTFDTLTLRDQASPDGLHLIVDHWNLQDGRPIQGGKGNDHGTAYWKQLERMAFVNPTSKGIAKGFATAAVVILDAVTMLCLQVPLTVDPMETVLTSKPYAGSPGTRSIDVDQGDKIFDTSPYVGAYKNAYQQRGDNFMGCPQPEIIGCNRSLSSNNPFGEFIITGEGGSGGSP